jgi:hypothetical protein
VTFAALQKMIWSEIKKLKGTTLRTLDQNKPFDIVEVTDQNVIVKPHARGIERTVEREAIEDAFGELALRGEIARTDIQDKYSNFNPAYVAAILASLPGVTVLRKPIRLYYKPSS